MADPGQAAGALPRGRSSPTIGVLIDNVDDDFQRVIWAGLEAAAEEAGASVQNFLGGDLDPGDPPSHRRNALFGLISPEGLDGLVVASTVLATHIGNARLDAYCGRFRPLPMVSLGFPLPSMPSIVSEGQLGIRELVEHLVDRHRRRRFLFLGGTAQNADAIDRERIFRETLERRGLPLDPRLVCRADFDPEKAYGAIRAAVQLGIPFDAVVAANDQMAISALEALRDAAVRVPEDVSVTGFDDIPGARRLELPLTTVRQPTFAMAKRAMQVVLGLVRGEPAPLLERHPTETVVRRSCGCLSEAVKRAGAPSGARPAGDLPGPPDLARAILAELERRDGAAPGGCGPDCLEALVRSFLVDLEGAAGPGVFVAQLDAALRASSAPGVADESWDDLLSILRRELGGRLPPAPGAEARAETLLHQARIVVKEATRQQQWRAHAGLARKTQTLQFVIDDLIGSFDVPTLLDNMARQLPRIGIRRCYLAVHASPGDAYQDARLLLAYDEHGRTPIGREGIPYPARQLLPGGILDRVRRCNVTWQPLIFDEEQIGFIGLDFNPLEEISSLALAEQIRSAFKASMMMQEIREKDRLLSNLDQMKNDFIANITHDFRSLVGIVLNACWVGMEADEGGSVRELKELCGMAYEAALKLKVAIDRLLELARMDERGLVLKVRKVGLKRFVAELAAFYRPVLAVSRIALLEELPAEEIDDLYTDADKVEEIMHNLISNAAKSVTHGSGSIRLSLVDRERTVELTVSDDGMGIPPTQLEAIFVRFKRLDAESRPWSGGSGIGLAFVKELASYLGGTITAQSEGPGKGSRFTLTLRKGKELFDGVEASDAPGDAAQASRVRDEFRQILASSLREKALQAGKAGG